MQHFAGSSGALPENDASDAAIMAKRSGNIPTSALARGVIQADTPKMLSYRETEGSSIRYECGVDAVFFQRDVARQTGPSHHQAPPTPSPGQSPAEISMTPVSASAHGSFVAFALDQPPPATGVTGSGMSPRSGGTSPDHKSLPGRTSTATSRSPSRADEPDAAIREVSELWPATEHRWPELLGAAKEEMEAMWDGEDVNWIVDGSSDAGNFSAAFGPPPVLSAKAHKTSTTSAPNLPKKSALNRNRTTPKSTGVAKAKRSTAASHLSSAGNDDGPVAAYDSTNDGLLFEAMQYILDGAAVRNMPGHYNVSVAATAVLVMTGDGVPDERTTVDLSTGTKHQSFLGSSLGEPIKASSSFTSGSSKSRRASFRAQTLPAGLAPVQRKDAEGSESAPRKRAMFGDSVDDIESDDGNAKDGTMRRSKSGASSKGGGGAGLPSVVDTKPTSKRHADATTYVRNLRVVPVESVNDLKALRNLWAAKALEIIGEGQRDMFSSAAFGEVADNASDGDVSDAGKRHAGGSLIVVTLTVTQRCSIAQTKVSQIRFNVVDGAAAVPSFHEVLRCLRQREPLPRTLPMATLRDPITRLLVAGASKKERSHHVLVECFSVANAIDALESVAAARTEEVKTNIVSTSAGVSAIAYDLTDERRALRAKRRELLADVQILREKTEGAEKLVSSLSRSAYGSKSDLVARQVREMDEDDDDRSLSARSDSTESSVADSMSPSVADEFASRFRSQDQYVEDRRNVVKKQAATLAQCQKTWQDASSRGLELRKLIAGMKKAMDERRHCEERARMAREAEFAEEMSRLQRDVGGAGLSPQRRQGSPATSPLRFGRARDAASVHNLSTASPASPSSTMARSHHHSIRVGKLRRRLQVVDDEAHTNDEKRAYAFNARERSMQEMLQEQRATLAGVERAATKRSKEHAASRKEYHTINARLFELSVMNLRVLTLYRNHYGPHFPDFLKQEDMRERLGAAVNRSDASGLSSLTRPESAAIIHRSASVVPPSPLRNRRSGTPQLSEGGKVRAPRMAPKRAKVLATSGSDLSSRDVAFPSSSCDPVLQGSVEAGTLAKRTPKVVKASLSAAFELLWHERGMDASTCPPLGGVHDDLLLFPLTYGRPAGMR